MSDQLNLSDFFKEFLISKEIEEGCSKATIRAYEHDLTMFIKIVGDLSVNSPFIRQKIRLFLKFLKDKGYTKRGLARKIATLRSFFKFLTLNDFIKKNPMETIRSPKIRREENLPKFLDISEMKKILKYLKNKSLKVEKNLLEYLIVRILYSTMARVSELCKIKISDIDFNAGFIKLRGKGNKERFAPIDDETLRLIKRYLNFRGKITSNDYLLVNYYNKQHLKTRTVENYIRRIKIKCGFPDTKIITPHIFRHTGATHLRRSGMDISELQDILGHSSPNTTRIYVKNDISKIKESYKCMHPLNKIKAL
ncbi:MAG: site-specific tyrosine recombinase/integron integrase [Promethearchaeota archaeon]